jgi:hypothetical protein
MSEFLIRVKPSAGGGFAASIRQFAPSSHPEVRAVQGPVSRGEGATAPAAMLAAIVAHQIPDVPVRVFEQPGGC